MKRIVLIRHGKADCNIVKDTDIMSSYDQHSSLTTLGIEQIKSLSKKIPLKYAPDRIYSSPLRRAADSAKIFAALTNLTINYDDRLSEVRTESKFSPPISGKTWTHILKERRMFPDKEAYKGVESVQSHFKRISEFFRDTVESISLKNQETLVIFTHAFSIEVALLYFLRLDVYHLKYIKFRIKTASMFVIEYCPKEKIYEIFNLNN